MKEIRLSPKEKGQNRPRKRRYRTLTTEECTSPNDKFTASFFVIALIEMTAEEKHYLNPQGLNEILSEILGHPVYGDWDREIPSEVYVGKWKKEQIKGKTAQQWGDMFQKCACSYLAKKLKRSGWELFHKQKIGENEYDCVGWKDKPRDKQIPDLAIEMYFPIPKGEEKYEFEHVIEKTDQMVRRLEKISSKSKYIVIGVPHDSEITTRERLHPNIKVVYQEYKFKKTRIEKRK